MNVSRPDDLGTLGRLMTKWINVFSIMGIFQVIWIIVNNHVYIVFMKGYKEDITLLKKVIITWLPRTILV